MRYLWLIPLCPALGAAVLGLAGIRAFSRKTAAIVACSAIAAALIGSVVAFVQMIGLAPDARTYEMTIGAWIPKIPLQTTAGMGFYELSWGLRIDPLAGVMLLVIAGIGTAIHVYATAYMADEPRGGFSRFFAYLNLFCAFMLLLVLGSNFMVMFVGWEGVGLSSYLLIGFWYEKPGATRAARKAFLVNRIADCGLLLGICLTFVTFGTLDFVAVRTALSAVPIETASFGVISAITLLLFVGAIGKSAQFPLHVWLPDAMEGPTPVSALIHAATLVTAGVYLLARNAALFAHAPMTLDIVLTTGVFTAFMAALVALVQTDIKRVLAYSTVSQVGYMFAAMGAGAFAAGTFHMLTHAFFKAVLFLGGGCVVHAMSGGQDMRQMGGLRRYLPTTFVAMAIGTLAIAGMPPFSGFFSKDEILRGVFVQHGVMGVLLLATAFITAFYMTRLMVLTFFGQYAGGLRGQPVAQDVAAVHGVQHPHDAHAHGHADEAGHEVSHGPADTNAEDRPSGPVEAPRTMTVPMLVLAVGAVVTGFFGLPFVGASGTAFERFLEPGWYGTGAGAAVWPGVHESAMRGVGVSLGLMFVAVLIAVSGCLLAWNVYERAPAVAERFAVRWTAWHRVLLHRFYVDEFYDATLVKGALGVSRVFWAVDRRVVDGVVNGSGWMIAIGAWCSGRLDRVVVDGAVSLVADALDRSSHRFRRLQSGLVQNYALVMVVGVMALVSLYLLVR